MMINIKKLIKEDIGRRVVLVLGGSAGKEYKKYGGKIVKWEDDCIYVRYSQLHSTWSVSCNDERGLRSWPSNLDFTEPPKPVEIVTRWDLMDLD